MYRRKDRKTIPLFPELFPFGGKLNEKNRWIRIAELIPLEELEEEYAKYFSDVGRPGTDAQLVIGLLLLKHMTGLSDEVIVQDVLENPYMQAFCGFEKLVTEEILDPGTLTKMRERNRIKGSFGNGKEHYGLDGVRYTIKDGSEIWVRAGILAMNLKAAVNHG